VVLRYASDNLNIVVEGTLFHKICLQPLFCACEVFYAVLRIRIQLDPYIIGSLGSVSVYFIRIRICIFYTDQDSGPATLRLITICNFFLFILLLAYIFISLEEVSTLTKEIHTVHEKQRNFSLKSVNFFYVAKKPEFGS